MKSGCFVKSIIVITILVAAIMYIIQHKSWLFFEPGKKIVSGLIMDDWDKKFNFIKNTPEKTELKFTLEKYIKNLKYKDIPDNKNINRIFDMIKTAAKDSIITRIELKEITDNLKSINQNERPEQN